MYHPPPSPALSVCKGVLMTSDVCLDDFADADGLHDEATAIGQYAEGAISDLFKRSGYDIEPFGIERVFKRHLEIITAERDATPSVRNKLAYEHQRPFVDFLRSFPDFVAFRNASGCQRYHEVFPVELKFRQERMFRDGLTTVRLSLDTIRRYKNYWPSTLLAIVCYHRRTILATRIHKLRLREDSRIPISLHERRRSWFFDLEQHDFLPLWKFVNGYFSQEDVERTATAVVTWANRLRSSQRSTK
jgi:hypothetical protein